MTPEEKAAGVSRVERALAKDIIEYGAAFEYRKKFLWFYRRVRLNPLYLVIHRAPEEKK